MKSQQYRLSELASKVSGYVQGDAAYIVDSIATLQSAGKQQLAFIANPHYRKYLATTHAGAVLVSEQDLAHFSGNAIVCANPYLAYAQLSSYFLRQIAPNPGVDPSASVHPNAMVDPSASIAANVVIAADVVIEADVVIGANVVIAEGCKIGRGSRLNANVTCYSDVSIGNNCLIHSGAVLGADGFGFANEKGDWIKIAQLGGVRIGNAVEVGAGTTIDRGAIEDTVIEDGVILDNQIQIAHNVVIGEKTAIAGCTAIAGSTKIGDRCTIAGACGVTGHLEIAANTHITAMSLVTKSITEPGAYSSGTGMLPSKAWKKSVVRFRQLDDIAKRLKSLEEQLTNIKGS